MRFPDWKPRLTAYLASIARAPFAPGAHDCALFAAGCIEAMTGQDLARDLRGTYKTTKQGLKALRAAGFDGIEAYAAAHFPEIHRSEMIPGDLAIVSGEGVDWALGILQGEAVYVLTPGGLGFLPLTAIRHLYAVR